jgi:hypothetical protein
MRMQVGTEIGAVPGESLRSPTVVSGRGEPKITFREVPQRRCVVVTFTRGRIGHIWDKVEIV